MIVKSGRILASGYNRINVFNRNALGKFNNSIHAEESAIMELLHRPADLFGSSIYVSRVGRSGSLLMAKPCEFCMRLIRSVGIKKIFYSDSNGSITMEKVNG